ncbi:MAG: hypothetical protein E4G98_03070 [Promethearchaeota archaeon]|nr:MAG: hypothetical protein E4G98_03070 [Candidatus Lokiarchaeota archaeon]
MNKISWATTVVGSFPYENTKKNMEQAFWDQIHAGVDYPCYPQLVSMMDQFFDPAIEANCGIIKKGKKYYLEGDFTVPPKPIALEYGQFVLDFFEKYPEAKFCIKGWKACLTGPFTLAGEIIIPPEKANGKRTILYEEPRAIMNAEICSQLATMMADVAREYVNMGASIISMDEPSLGLIIGARKTFFHPEETFVEILNQALAPITAQSTSQSSSQSSAQSSSQSSSQSSPHSSPHSSPQSSPHSSPQSSIHVCGRISPRLRDVLLHTNVNIVDHEFQKADNEGLYTRDHLESHNKVLAYGILERSVAYQANGSLESYVETPAKLEELISKVVSHYGKENLILKPDCGFGGLKAIFGQDLASEIVRQKLSNLTQAMQKF